MNNPKVLLPLIFILVLTLFSYKATFSFFSNQATSTSNVFAAASTFPTPTPIPGIANHVVISEVQITGGPSHTTDDFIELYNPTNAEINLGTNDYKLVKRSGSSTTDTDVKVFSSSNKIPAYGFFLWANSGYSTITATPDVTTTDSLASSNSVALKVSSSGVIIDALSWNSASESYKEGTEFSPEPGTNQSLERKAYSTSTATSMNGGTDALKGNGYDTDNNATDFVLRTVSQPQNSGSSTETP